MELIIGVRLVLVCVVDPNEYIRKMFIISILFRRFSFLPLDFTKGSLYKAQCGRLWQFVREPSVNSKPRMIIFEMILK